MRYRRGPGPVGHFQKRSVLMSMAEPESPPRPTSSAAFDALSFQAPYVVERLVKSRVVDSPAEAEKLFTEVKRYLVLCAISPGLDIGMHSARVDEAWHAFLLYTAQYSEFCKRYFGRYLGHAPTNEPRVEPHVRRRCQELTFREFCERYEAVYNEALPDVWYNARGVTTAQRMFNDAAGNTVVVHEDSVAGLLDEHGEVILSVNDIAYSALKFISKTGAFYVRELPGGLIDEEKIALAEALISVGALRLAP
jgi:hypothetical protein